MRSRVRLKSGNMGWRGHVQDIYESYTELVAYDQSYGIATRLGYKTVKRLWQLNPRIEGSPDPRDYAVVRLQDRPASAEKVLKEDLANRLAHLKHYLARLQFTPTHRKEIDNLLNGYQVKGRPHLLKRVESVDGSLPFGCAEQRLATEQNSLQKS